MLHDKHKLHVLFNEQPKEIDGSYQGSQTFSCHRMHQRKIKVTHCWQRSTLYQHQKRSLDAVYSTVYDILDLY